jgi:hypothetical protein
VQEPEDGSCATEIWLLGDTREGYTFAKARSVGRIDFCFVSIFARSTVQIVAILMVDAEGHIQTTYSIPENTIVNASV